MLLLKPPRPTKHSGKTKLANYIGFLFSQMLNAAWTPTPRRTVGQISKKCKETSNLTWSSLIWFILVLFFCWNLFCTLANLRIKCVTETKMFVLFYKNIKSSFLHDSHIWLWCFFTFFFALAHSVAWKASCMVYYNPLSDHYYHLTRRGFSSLPASITHCYSIRLNL